MDKIRRNLAGQENGYKNFVAKYMGVTVPNKKELMAIKCFKYVYMYIYITKLFTN